MTFVKLCDQENIVSEPMRLPLSPLSEFYVRSSNKNTYSIKFSNFQIIFQHGSILNLPNSSNLASVAGYPHRRMVPIQRLGKPGLPWSLLHPTFHPHREGWTCT